MPTIGTIIDNGNKKKLYAAVSHPSKHPGIHAALKALGDVIVLHRPDGSKVSRTSQSHWPPEEWAVIRAAFYAREYTVTGSREVHITA